MLRYYRRFWALFGYLIITVPLAVAILRPEQEPQPAEMRTPAHVPPMPHTLDEWIALPGKINAYLSDHFGMRREMIRAYSVIAHKWLRGGTASVEVGLEGWLFLRSEETLAQSAGLVVRKARIVETADTIAHIRDALNARGIRFVFASPPNSATIYPDKLPEWARNKGQVTEYDLMLKALIARGIQTVDLRPILRNARADGDIYYHNDTHWTHRGAIAGFNALTAAIGHADWSIDPSTALSPPKTFVGGDLADLLGLSMDVAEPRRLLNLPQGNAELLTPLPWQVFSSYRSTSNVTHGPTVMIVGDSYTYDQFGPMVLAHAPQFIWTHHCRCTVDWKWIDQFHPDEVWWMPTERYALCDAGRGPPVCQLHPIKAFP